MAVVLVVDDEIGIARLLEDVLVDQGHEVLVASNGKDALELAHRTIPAVVLSDYMMPVMDGAALISAMAQDEMLAGIPVVLMSSLPEAVIAERATGYRLFVRKPFNIYALVDLLAGLIAERR